MIQKRFLDNFAKLKFINMICPMLIVALSLALIVLMGGLFLLAYSKKEGLGKLTKIASYVAIVFGIVVFVGGLICAIMCSTCNKGKCDKDKKGCSKDKMECSKYKECSKDKKECCEKVVIIEKDVKIIKE
jgi:cytochrome bd-type quinol oxidase subunit 2